MVKPKSTVPSKIREHTRFYPYFKDCIGAIDGIHIPATVKGRDVSSYRNRHGKISQNVLAACNFDLEFIYVLSGWEGLAHDSKLLHDALSRRNGLKFPIEPNDESPSSLLTQETEENNFEELLESQEQQRENANEWRTTMASNMWVDAQNARNQMLDDAEGKQITNIYVRNWLDDLQAASYEADNLVDQIATDARQSELEASRSRKSKKRKLSNFFSFIPRISYNQDMKNKLEGILRRFKDFENRINVLGLTNNTVGEKPSPRQLTTSLIEESEVFGRDEDKEAIVNLLLTDDHDGRNKVSVM
nr:uncharacterized protein LOC125418638 [Ziziphus jujuba var. spinosa]